MTRLLKIHFILALLLSAQTSMSKEIGVASAVNKNTTDLTLEEERKLVEAGYKIIQNHTLETDAIGRAALLLIDGTSFSIGPNSSVTLDKFIYNPETAEGSLEVSSRGLLRLVGGKVTKKMPALIRTNSATVGIRGGITIIQTQGLSTSAAFVYGEELTMTPNQNSAGATSLTENGFIVTVEDPAAEVGEPEQLSETFLAELQKGLEARENDEESSEESTEEESSEESSEESTEDESSEESTEEESSEESTQEESNQEQSGESSGETSSEDSPSEDQGENNETQQESSSVTESTSGSDNSTAQDESRSNSSGETQTSDQAVTSNEVDNDTQPNVDESALDSSGVSDNSSEIEPSELSTADDVIDTAVDIDATSDEVEEASEETEEASEASIEDTASVETTETVVEEAPFDAQLSNENIQINENETDINLSTLLTNKDDDVEVIVIIEGDDKDFFRYESTSKSLIFVSGSDYEEKQILSVSLRVTREGEEVIIPVNVTVRDIDEPPLILTNIENSYSEDLAVGSKLIDVSATDPENQEVTYTISGEESENFSIDAQGNISLADNLDYEQKTSYSFTLTASDGALSSSTEITINVRDVNESPDVTISLQGSEFAENIAAGSTIATVAYTDPESDTLTYTLSGTGSDQFSVDDQGVITLKTGLDYEIKTSYELTLTSSDGTNSVQTQISFSVTDISELALSLDNTEVTLAENISTGSSVAIASSSDAAGEVTYSIVEGTAGSSIFAIDSQGRITLESSLDFETKTSYTLDVSVTDGKETVTKQLVVTVSDVDLSVTSSLASASQAENISMGTSILTLSTSNAEGTLSYSLTDDDNKFAINSSTGEVTLANALDYETKTSHSFTVTVTDGVTTSTETFTLNVTDVDLALSASLASSSQLENISTGTTILTSSTSESEGTVSYSITDADNKFAINSSTGEVTLDNALDYENKTSHSFTVTATDGVTTTSQTFTLTVDNVAINTLAVTLANSGAALAESSSSGTTVGSSSISNPDSETVSYSLSGTGSTNFAVDSSGNITTNAALDYETAKSYSLTLTATSGGTTITDAFTVNVKNVEELQSAVLRYSAAYNSVSRSGFSATATRGPSGSSLPAYTLEQVGTTNSTDITSVDDTSLNYVPVEINSGTVLNWRYYFPIDTSGNGEFSFAPNSSALDGKYYSTQGTAVTTTIDNADFLTAGRLEGAKYWFMTTDKSAADIDYTSASSKTSGSYIAYGNATSYSRTGWNNAISAAGLDNATLGNNLPSDLSGYSLIIDYRLNYTSKASYTTEISNLATWLQNPANTLVLLAGEQCCEATQMLNYGNLLLDAVGGGEVGSASRDGSTDTENFDISSSVVSSLFSTLSGDQFYCNGCGPKITQVSGSGVNLTPYLSFWSGSELGSDYNGNIFMSTDIEWQTASSSDEENQQLLNALADLPNQTASSTTSTYNLYEDQVTLAGQVYTDAIFQSHVDRYATNKRVYGFLVIPIENFAASGTSNDYFIPNFIPKTLWSYGDVGHDYCLGMASNSASDCNTYENYYDFSNIALSEAVNSGSERIDTSRFAGGVSDLPEGQSMWWQVLDTSGNFNKGVGLWAQISFKDSYTGWAGVATHDDQESLLNVVISSIDDRKNDTTRYSAGDTSLGMDGYHYWSYQGATNADNDGLGINYGTSPIECATSSDTGCFWGTDSAETFRGAMITSSDPYKSGDMTLSVNYNSNNDTFSTGTFNQSIVQVDVKPSSLSGYHVSLQAQANFRSVSFYRSSATSYSGFFNGILEFDVSGTGNSQLSSIRSSSTLASFTFDATNDDLQVVAPMTVSAPPSNNYTSNWTTVDTGSMTLKFGDATNDEAKSAYISHEVFGAEIQDDGTQIDGTSGGSNNLAGVMVSYNTLDEKDSDLFQSSNFLDMPDTDYSTWGFWAMSAADISPNSGDQNASVHLGTWVGGELVDQNEIPTSGSASMTGSAAVNVAYRYNQTGTNYDVHKYTTAADVAASFSWGTSGYSGTLNFTNFDHKNPIIANAGFSGFVVAITGTNNTYTGNSTTSIQNDWLGGAAVAGALFGDSSPTESGGRVNVNLYKSGDTATAGANDFYMAEGIYLLCENGGC